MTELSTSFCMSMLHSIWQAGLLFLLYKLVAGLFLQNHSPLEKRNLLFVLISVQLVLFIITFCICYGAGQTGNLFLNLGDFLSSEKLQSATPWIFGSYLFMLAYKLTKAGYIWYQFKMQYRSGLQKPNVDLRLFTTSKAYQLGIKRKVTLWLSTNIRTPVTFGFLKPVILMPLALLNNIDPSQAEALILHELSHIKSNDYLLNWYLQIIEALFFYNPFVKALGRNIKMEREKYCDISVMDFSYSPALYAEALLKAERLKQLLPAFQLAAVSRKKQLFERILYFTNAENTRVPKRINFIAPLMGILMILVLFSLFIFRSTGNLTDKGWLEALKNAHPAFRMQNDGRTIISNPLTGLNDWVKELEKQGPAIRKEYAYIPEIQKKGKVLINELSRDFAVPVSIKENDASEQIIVTEESSGSKTSSVKVYRLDYENGQWVVKPEWIGLAKLIRDSVLKNLDTSVRKELSPQ